MAGESEQWAEKIETGEGRVGKHDWPSPHTRRQESENRGYRVGKQVRQESESKINRKQTRHIKNFPGKDLTECGNLVSGPVSARRKSVRSLPGLQNEIKQKTVRSLCGRR